MRFKIFLTLLVVVLILVAGVHLFSTRSGTVSTDPLDDRSVSAKGDLRASDLSDEEIIARFAEIWTDTTKDTGLAALKWFGVKTLQNPMDVWMTQEILYEVKPDFIVETGTFRGGSAALWATLLEQINPDGRVITIDLKDWGTEAARKLPIVQRRVDFVIGNSVDPEVVAEVARRVEGAKVVVILDSWHKAPHVLRELNAYAPLVEVGSYIIVQDGILGGHPILPEHGPGPFEAVESFLSTTDDFEIDKFRERLLFTYNVNGFLRRVAN